MPTPPSLSEVIAKLEAAGEGSRELDAEIALAVGWTRGDFAHRPRWVDPSGQRTAFNPDHDNAPFLHFTRSLDAAATLVPEGWTFYLDGSGPDGLPGCHACVYDPHAKQRQGGCIDIATPALALCIASLRARQALTPSQS